MSCFVHFIPVNVLVRCFFVVIIHCYRELFAYSTPTEVIPTYLLLVVNCFEVISVVVVDLRVIERLETVEE